MTRPTIHPFLMNLLRESSTQPIAPAPDDVAQWDSLIEAAEQHNLLPALSHWLTGLEERERTHALVLKRMKPLLAGIAVQNLMLTEELALILRRLHQRQIPCMPIRGPALAEQLYGDVTARAMGDLDLLVQRERLSDVAQTLAELDYREIDRRPGFARTYSYTLEFVKTRHGSIYVEPHWTIAYPPFADLVDMDGVWQRARPSKVVGVDTLALSRTDLLLHLCFHLIHKGEQAPLLWSYELDRLIRQDPDAIDWPHIVHTARQTGQGELLANILSEVHALFDSPIPGAVVAQLTAWPEARQDGPPRGFWHRRFTPLLLGESGVDGRESLAQLLAMKGLGAKWRYVCGILFPSSDFMRTHYGLSECGHPWLGVRYVARLLSVLWEGSKGLVSLVAFRPTPRQSPPR
ncbi:MAG: nucleotidyltransferase family protein [Nitrospirota bacterium]|nr:nucleotidyltransferase family protein [Nitrospirota bacterium]